MSAEPFIGEVERRRSERRGETVERRRRIVQVASGPSAGMSSLRGWRSGLRGSGPSSAVV